MSRPPRLLWVEAVWESDLKPLQKLVALALADHANGLISSVAYSRLMDRTGMSRDATARALTALRAAGWLAVLTAGRQQQSTRYVLSSPGDGPLSSPGDGPLTDVQQSVSASQRSVSGVPAVRETDTTTIPTISTTMGAAVPSSPAAALAAVVVDGLPSALQEQINAATVEHACRRLVALGWTPERLGPAVRNRSWNGAGCGVVVEWLRGLGEPKASSGTSRPPWCGICVEETRMDETDPDAPRRCRRCGGAAA